MNLIVFFTITYCFDELLLHYLSQFEFGLNFLLYLFRNIIFMFCVFSLINLFIKKNILKKIVFFILIIFIQIAFMLNICINDAFSVFFTFNYIFKMSISVATVFKDDVILVIINNLFCILILILPIFYYIGYYLFLDKIKIIKSKKMLSFYLMAFIVLTISFPVCDVIFKTENTVYDSMVRERGIVGAQISSIYQNLIYSDKIDNNIFLGSIDNLNRDTTSPNLDEDIDMRDEKDIIFETDRDPKMDEEINLNNIEINNKVNETKDVNSKKNINDAEININYDISDYTAANVDNKNNVIIAKKKYKPNILNIDFNKLISNEENEAIRDLHLSISKIDPTYKNEYTGIFKDKLLIQISAEAFSPYFIDKEWTPTLYELVNGSFVFDNFYTPNYGQSTIGGEFANLTGLLPLWINGTTSALFTKENSFPFTFSNMSHILTNNKVVAYHSGRYVVYDRPKLYETWGFDEYIADGSGLELLPKIDDHKYFYNDSGLIDLAFEDYLKEQKEKMLKNESFKHFYYMTISGHMPYNFNKTVTKFYKSLVDERYKEKSEEVRAYIATQYELEYALSHMMEIIKRNDMLDKVVICMANDHYPYALTDVNGKDLYKEFAGFDYKKNNMEYYKSALIIYSQDIKNVHIDTPCSSVDVTPTLLNLFGYDYDSRMLTGRDILDMSYKEKPYTTNLPIVYFPLFSDLNFITIRNEIDTEFKNYALQVAKLKKNISVNIQKYNYYKYIKQYIDNLNEIKLGNH